MKLSRRDFLKLCGASAAMLGVGATVAPPTLDHEKIVRAGRRRAR